MNRNCKNKILDHLPTLYRLWSWPVVGLLFLWCYWLKEINDFSFRFAKNERQHIALAVFLNNILQASCTTWEAICVWIDYFSSRDNEHQQGTLWRNSCFPEINILFGSLSPSSKILIWATASLQFVPFVTISPGSLRLCVRARVWMKVVNTLTQKIAFLSSVTPLTWPSECIWHYSYCMAVSRRGSYHAHCTAVVIWLNAFQQDESTGRNTDNTF